MEEVEDKGFNLKLTKKERGDMDRCLELPNRPYSICSQVWTVEEEVAEDFNNQHSMDKQEGEKADKCASLIISVFWVLIIFWSLRPLEEKYLVARILPTIEVWDFSKQKYSESSPKSFALIFICKS